MVMTDGYTRHYFLKDAQNAWTFVSCLDLGHNCPYKRIWAVWGQKMGKSAGGPNEMTKTLMAH